MAKKVASVTIENDHSPEILKALAENEDAILAAWGELAEGFAKELCPVDTGRLRNSITYEARPSEHAVYIGTNVEYGKYVELGTSNKKYPKQPFLRPAIEDNKDAYMAVASDIVSG
jgi:HK97 gp10 family phage protein